MTKLNYRDTSAIVRPHSKGHHLKDMAVLHETVSHDIRGWSDIINNEKYLASIDYGIHGMTDLEGNIAWALGCGLDTFIHCGGVNERAVGIEQVSWIPAMHLNNAQKALLWKERQAQLHATAKLLAAWHNADKTYHPLTYSNGLHPGVTTHWDVSQHFVASEGHTDCWPLHKKGYYPVEGVIAMAVAYAKQDIHF